MEAAWNSLGRLEKCTRRLEPLGLDAENYIAAIWLHDELLAT